MTKSESLLEQMKTGKEMSRLQQFRLVFYLSIPAIMAQVTSVMMQYIDASMVGSLGAGASASIGLVSSSTWLFGGLTGAVAAGFSIQTAHRIGAGKIKEARGIMRQSFLAALIASLFFVVCGLMVCNRLPAWLGASQEIQRDAAQYFLVFILSLPAIQLNRLAGGMLQCSGDMRTPGCLNILMCVLDVVFNSLLIFPSRTISFAGLTIFIPGAGFHVMGAALGTAFAELVTAILMASFLCFRSHVFKLKCGGELAFEKKMCVQGGSSGRSDRHGKCNDVRSYDWNDTYRSASWDSGDRCKFVCNHCGESLLYAGVWDCGCSCYAGRSEPWCREVPVG